MLHKQIIFSFLGATGNFLCPAVGLSFNAFQTVMDIDTMGTFNTSKIVFEKYMLVCMFIERNMGYWPLNYPVQYYKFNAFHTQI